ncbi:MAG: hypothetical protein IT440_05600 [Phycisphaeraceae bacterium]|nr:hypothetical protein [Phycisphaeraceae bacterium]
MSVLSPPQASPAKATGAEAFAHLDSVALSSPDSVDASARCPRQVEDVVQQVFESDPEYQQYGRLPCQAQGRQLLSNYLFSTGEAVIAPEDAFNRLRWGGLLVHVAGKAEQVDALRQRYHQFGGFSIETPVTRYATRWMGMVLPGLSRRGYYFTARKLDLIPPGLCTDRFTYNVRLERHGADDADRPVYVVAKEVPTYENVLWRLCEKHQDLDDQTLSRRARKLIDSVFPVFLTREAAILQILERNMPEPYRRRLPRVVGVDKDDRGFVRKLQLNWLRMSGSSMSQLEFAMQSADLLRVLHDKGGMIHLDLRLDNFVICDNQVCFVDFGSAVRVGENIRESPLLTSLFEEMMRTSEIQRLLGRWMSEGKVTSEVIREQLHKVDKAIDFFYLAVQMNRPHFNPEFTGLVRFDRESAEALAISSLTGSILRPRDPRNSPFKSAQDILRGLENIERQLQGVSSAA